MDLKLILAGELNVEYDTETNTFEIINQSLKVINLDEKKTWNEHIINSSEVKYSAFTIGGKTNVGNSIPLDTKIDLFLLDDTENVVKLGAFKSHKQTRGRIDGLKKIYKELNIIEGDLILFRYNHSKNTLEIKKKVTI